MYGLISNLLKPKHVFFSVLNIMAFFIFLPNVINISYDMIINYKHQFYQLF